MARFKLGTELGPYSLVLVQPREMSKKAFLDIFFGRTSTKYQLKLIQI